MGEVTAVSVSEEIARALRALDIEDVKRTYQDQNEFVCLERWLPPALVERMRVEVERARPAIHRNYVPRHKKGGSVSFYTLVEQAPTILALYRYKGARYTVLVGLVERSSSRLLCQPFKNDPGRPMIELRLRTDPGTVVAFNGDKLWHAITPLGPGEERVSLTLEYVTNPAMSFFGRFVSNMKDAIAYFGFRTVFRGPAGA